MGRFKSSLKYGCFGCLAVGAGLILIVGLMAAAAFWNSGNEPVFEQQTLTQDLPSTVMPGLESPDGSTDRLPSYSLEDDRPPAGVGQVVLRMKVGSFRIEPGPPGTPIEVEADYDTGRFRLAQHYEPDGDGNWTYRLDFGPKSLFRLFKFDDDDEPRLIVRLPRGVPMTLDGDLTMGQSQVELGGLWILDARFEMGMGEHSIRFSEPSPAPMETFVVDGGMGEFDLSGIGNASPGRVDVRQRMGELRLDLNGAWVRDGFIFTRCSMGECGIRVPDDVGLEIERVRITIGGKTVRVEDRPRPEPDASLLRLDLGQRIGELRVE